LNESHSKVGEVLILCKPNIEIIPQLEVSSERQLLEALDDAVLKGWEGLILRRDVGYEGKRTKNMLKLKKMKDAEYTVVDIESGLVDDGRGKKVKALSAIGISHKGCKVGVGSGFTFEERLLYDANPDLLIGKVVCVKYFDETQNKDGGWSLRFPIFKGLYGDKRDV
jgi:DNA ligase-1